MNRPGLQRGTVIIVVVFIVSVIAAIAIRLTGSFQLLFARADHAVAGSSLQQAVLSVEEVAAWTLDQDAEDDSNNGRYSSNGVEGSYDHLQEAWAAPLTAPIEEVAIEASMEDALSRFNLNQLQGRPSPYNPNGLLNERFTVAQQRFMRLLPTYPDEEMTVDEAMTITQAVIDWVDTDDALTGSGGAENGYYSSLEKPYRAANRFFSSVTELRQIKGITNLLYDYLEPLVIALPNTTGFNINTAPVAVMRTLNKQNIETPLSEEEALTLMSARPTTEDKTATAYQSVDDFLSSSEAGQVFDADPALWPVANGLRTGSQYFLLHTKADLSDYQSRQMSLLKRENTSTGIQSIVLKREKRLME